MSFLDDARLQDGGPRLFTRAVERFLWHTGFDDVRITDGSGDEGADLLGSRDSRLWVIQCKWTTRATFDIHREKMTRARALGRDTPLMLL